MVFAGVMSGKECGFCTWKSSLSWQTSEVALLTVNTQLPVLEGVYELGYLGPSLAHSFVQI